MTNELKTRRLIVTLPDVSGEEADTAASALEEYLGTNASQGELSLPYTDGVTHALGETLPDGVVIETDLAHNSVVTINRHGEEVALDNLYEARQLAGALLAIPGVADAEPPTNCQHCGAAGHLAIDGPLA